MDGFENDLRGKLARAAKSAENLEGEVYEKLAARLQSDEAGLATRIESLEQRIADYQGDIEYRFRSLQDASADVGSLGASIHASIEKTASEARGEMQSRGCPSGRDLEGRGRGRRGGEAGNPGRPR